MATDTLNIFVCGDVMTGRGIDQIHSHPSDPEIFESFLKDARDYVRIAEEVNGTIPRRVTGDYLWENVSAEWEKHRTRVKLINLETAVTTSDRPWRGKGINYRMHPDNIDVLTSAQIDICALANNHVLDWEVEGLRETLGTLEAAGIKHAGAGENLSQAMAPAVYRLAGGRRLLMFSMATKSTGTPGAWRATSDHAGVYLLEDLDSETVAKVKNNIGQYREEGDLVVISLHWGGNWGYEVPVSHRDFAHALIDEVEVDLIHGHSSHHPIAIEIYRGRPVLYGCGDFINDYEGIRGLEEFRNDLALMYFLDFDPRRHNKMRKMELVALQIRRFQLHYASPSDRRWLVGMLNRASSDFHTTFSPVNDHSIRVNFEAPDETG